MFRFCPTYLSDNSAIQPPFKRSYSHNFVPINSDYSRKTDGIDKRTRRTDGRTEGPIDVWFVFLLKLPYTYIGQKQNRSYLFKSNLIVWPVVPPMSSPMMPAFGVPDASACLLWRMDAGWGVVLGRWVRVYLFWLKSHEYFMFINDCFASTTNMF